MVDAVVGCGENAEAVIARYAAEKQLDDVVAAVVSDARTMPGRTPETLERWGMGLAMKELLGVVDPTDVRRALSAALATSEQLAS
jgi:hypothetical protein